jgi:hemolysin activation/secretion protein
MIGVLASRLCGLGQGLQPLAPAAVTPKEVERPAAAPSVTTRPGSPRTAEGDKPLNPAKPTLAINGVIIVKTSAEIQEAGVSGVTGLVVREIPFLDRPEFRQMVQKQFLGRQLTENSIRDLQDAIIYFCRDRGKLLVDVILPEQSIEEGVLQLWFLEGKVGKITVKNPGKKWFSDKFILRQVHLQPADSLDANRFNQDLNWLNNNPFRQVDVALKQGEKLGLTDVELGVEDRFPVRPYFGYEDTGTRYTGPDRLLTGFNWGNAFGLDHQFNYQYSTDINFDLMRAHSASYIAPLPWRHTLIVYGSYVDDKAEFPGGTTADGHSWQASARYSIPLPDLKKYRHEVSAGFDFKQSNNNLLSGGTNVLQNSDTDIAQFALTYSGALPDRLGKTAFGAELYYSPGGLTPNNDNTDFNNLRTDARAEYFYARFNASRITRLPYDFSWVLSGWGQLTGQRLLPSEELALGGYNTVRGYDERVVLGDNGWIINCELRTPAILLGNILGIRGGRDELQFLGFVDSGSVSVVDHIAADGDKTFYVLCSAGAGLRYTISRNLSLRFDYGFPLTEKALNEFKSRAHVGVLLSL